MTVWRLIAGFPEYEVSCEGAVRRAVTSRCGRFAAGHKLRLWIDPKGYAHATLMRNGKRKRNAVHRLVCRAFHGAPPSSTAHAAHGDGDPRNNNADNLRWATVVENCADRDLHGRTIRGDKSPNAKLTWEIVRDLRRRYSGQWGQRKSFADECGVSQPVIAAVLEGRTWIEPGVVAMLPPQNVCRNGHPKNSANTAPSGHCRVCWRETATRKRARRKAELVLSAKDRL